MKVQPIQQFDRDDRYSQPENRDFGNYDDRRRGPGPRDYAEPDYEPPPELYLTAPGALEDDRPAPWLARMLRLDVWGTSLLGPKARARMAGAGFLLVVVLAFELAAWSLLFNVVVNAGAWAVTGLTLVACVLGSLFASTVFLFERGFLTADMTVSRGKILPAYMLRLLVIAVSAFVTAHPVELFIFDNEIKQVLGKEALYREALARDQEIKRKRDKLVADKDKALATMTASLTDQRKNKEVELAQLREKIRQWSGDAAVADDQHASAARWERSTDKRLGMVQSEEEGARLRRNKRIARAKRKANRAARERAKAEKAAAEAQIVQLTSELAAINTQLNDLTKERDDKVAAEIDELKNRYADCLDELQKLPPGSRLEKCGVENWDPYRAGFVERVLTLYRIVDGRGAELPNDATAEQVAEFEIPRITLPQGRTSEIDKDKASKLSKIYWASFLIALVIPLLTLAFKLLQGDELRAYYSTRAQASAGNWHALQALEVQETLESHKRGPRRPRDPRGSY